MSFTLGPWAAVGLLLLLVGANGEHSGYAQAPHFPHRSEWWSMNHHTPEQSIYTTSTATIYAPESKPTTTINTTTVYVPTSVTLSTTSSTTITTSTTLSRTLSSTITSFVTSSTTFSTTILTTLSKTITAPPNPCPTECTISAGTVNVIYWPTSKPYSYPTTYVDTARDYTFTSPSVYLIVNTLAGYNSASQRAGPSGSDVVFPVNLDQVSTIVLTASSITRQLTLNDLGTNCPQSEPPSYIATAAPNGRCDPILVAPNTVKSWASPCNACGRFGLFDPPYAIPTLTGGLVTGPATTVAATPQPQSTTNTPPETHTAPSSPASEPSSASLAPATTPSSPSPTPQSPSAPITISSTSSLNDPNATATSPALVTTNLASKVTGELAYLISSLLVLVYLL